jgi:hypothetical protein
MANSRRREGPCIQCRSTIRSQRPERVAMSALVCSTTVFLVSVIAVSVPGARPGHAEPHADTESLALPATVVTDSSPGSTITSADCVEHPCAIAQAMEAASAGDTVLVAPGSTGSRCT